MRDEKASRVRSLAAQLEVVRHLPIQIYSDVEGSSR
jgi:hypothetical protein